jgi:hypothetical protein
MSIRLGGTIAFEWPPLRTRSNLRRDKDRHADRLNGDLGNLCRSATFPLAGGCMTKAENIVGEGAHDYAAGRRSQPELCYKSASGDCGYARPCSEHGFHFASLGF